MSKLNDKCKKRKCCPCCYGLKDQKYRGICAWLKYKSDSLIASGLVIIIPCLALISICLILIFSALYLVTGQGDSYSESLWETFMRTLDPGSAKEDSGWIHRLISATVALCGIIITSTLIGALTTGMEAKLFELKKGRTRVVEHNHTIILGWSPKIFDILHELILANENQRHPLVVILAQKDRIEMQEIIARKIENHKNTRIICRNGDPMSIHDLNIVSPNHARSIIILAPQNNNPDVSVIKTILAITNNPTRTKIKFHIVAEIKERKNLEVALIAGGDEVCFVHTDEIIARIIAQSGRQSGLSVILSIILSFKYDEIYFKREPSLSGKTFYDVVFSYPTSSVIGIMFADETVKICPARNTILQSNDQIIAIAEDDDALIMSPTFADRITYNPQAITSATIESAKVEKNIVLGWNSKAPLIAKQLDNYVAAGSELHFLTNNEKATKIITEQLVNELTKQKLYLHSGDITNRSDLQKLNLYTYHDVILLASEIQTQTEISLQQTIIEAADAECLICLLHLRNIIDKAGRKKTFNIVTEMFDIRNRELAEITRADDFIVSPNILSKYVAQLSENKNLTKVFDVLLTAEGEEIYLRPVTNYVKTEIAVTFYTVLESSMRQNSIAIGYRQMKYALDPAKFYGIVLNPIKEDKITFRRDDKIIVLAEE